jgi:polar amino acid transport system substrate-binding protein
LIIKEAFRRIGMEARVVHLPSERALVNANQGIDDGDFVRIAGIEKRYPNLIMVEEKICEFEFAAFSRHQGVTITDWQSLKPYNVGIITGWKILEANITESRSLTKVSTPEALFDLLLHDRADLVVFDRLQGNALIKERGLSGVKALSPLLAQRDMYLYLHKRHAGLVPKLAEALRQMKQDGTHQRLIDSVLKQGDSL